MSTVAVVVGPGRREVVKVTPGTTLSQVLATACSKHQLNPSLCSLVYNGLSGLPAGATVDVRRKEVTATSARTSIAMQLPSGRRLQQDFDANTTLWTVLQHFESESKEKLTRNVDSAGKVLAPAVVFMNREIDAVSMRSITLAAAGMSGSSLLRFVTKATGKTEKEFDAEMAVLEQQRKQEQEQLQKKAEEERAQRMAAEKAQREREAAMKQAREDEQRRMDAEQQRINQELDKEEKARQAEEERIRIQEEQRKREEEEAAARELEAEERHENERRVQFDNDMPDRYAGMQLADPPMIIRVGVPAGVALPPMPLPAPAPRLPLNREPRAFLPGEKDFDPRDFEIPDDFVETTPEDLQRIAALDRERKRKEEADKAVLKTRMIREIELSKQMSKFKKAAIRIRFADRIDLQGYFWTDETTEDIYEFVKQHLADPSVQFYLYTSPPKQRLPPQQTLLKQRLLPAAIVFIGFEGQASSLSPALLSEAQQAPRPVPIAIAPSSTTPAAAAAAAAPPTAADHSTRIPPRLPPEAESPATTKSGQKLPKWFQTAKKH